MITFIKNILWELLLTQKLDEIFKPCSKSPPSFSKQRVALFLNFSPAGCWLTEGQTKNSATIF